MGFFKRLAEHQQAYGFQTLRYLDEVCDGCIGDGALALFVSRHGPIERCSFCDATGRHGMRLDSLFEYMASCLAAEWDDPLNEVGWDGDDGCWTVETCDSWDLLDALDEPLEHPDLRSVFVDAFQHEWCQRSPYQLHPSEKLLLSWQRFSELVRTKHRYLFFLAPPTSRDDELIAPAEMLQAIGQAISNTPWRSLRQLPAGTTVVRARAHEPGSVLSSAADLGSPPVEHAGPNRMSPVGISMFYAAEDAALAAMEVRPNGGQAVTSARWGLSRPIWCLDLTELNVPSIFDATERASRPWLRFLSEFGEDLSKLATLGEVDYVPTQIVTEYVRDVLRTPTGEAIEAIAYLSSIDPTKRCWVIFAGAEQCADPDSAGEGLLLIDQDSIERTQT